MDIIKKADNFVDEFMKIPRHAHEEKECFIDKMQKSIISSKMTQQNERLKLRLNVCRSAYFRWKHEYNEVFKIMSEVSKYKQYQEDSKYFGWIFRDASRCAYFLGMHAISIENAYKSLSYFESSGIQVEIASGYLHLGMSYMEIRNYDLCLEYYQKAFQMAQTNGFNRIIMPCLNNIAYTLIVLEKYDEAKKYLNELSEILSQKQTNHIHVVLNINKARIAIAESKTEEANDYIDLAKKENQTVKDITYDIIICNLESQLFELKGDIESALAALEEGLNLTKRLNSMHYELMLEKAYVNIMELSRDYETAYHHQTNCLVIQEKLADELSKSQYNYMRIQNEVDALQNENLKLYKETEVINELLNITRHQLEETQVAAIYALAHLTEYRDQITCRHMVRIMEHVKFFCEVLRNDETFSDLMTPDYIMNLAQSASLHDIGKIGISDDILKKPGKLTPQEFETIKQHTIIGKEALAITGEILKEKSFLSLAQMIAYSHHEKWDGSGYPEGLRAFSIPLECRIVAIIDVYDALVNDRPYKKASTHEEAIEIISEGVGTHFDPVLANYFILNHQVFQEINHKYSDEKLPLVTFYET